MFGGGEGNHNMALSTIKWYKLVFIKWYANVSHVYDR